MRAWWREFRNDDRGAIALKFAFIVPPLALLIAAAVDLRAVAAQRADFQQVAEAAALAGAGEMSMAVSDDVAIERARAFAEAQLKDSAYVALVEPTIEPMGSSRVLDVEISTKRPSFFGNLLPPGGWDVRASAAAASVSRVPLCIIASGASDRRDKVILVADRGVITAPQCLIHSNYDIDAGKGQISASLVQAVTTARGSILPGANVGAVPLEDPFAATAILTDQSCSGGEQQVQYEGGFHTIAAGVHCGGFQLKKGAQVTLAPGDHYFIKGDLDVDDESRLVGVDVALIFDRNSKSDFKGHSTVDLDGRKTGPFAGFVIITTRNNDQDFKINSDRVSRLLGVLYIPSARLFIEGGKDIAKDSDWTVIVAESIELKGSPSLFINANYAGSDVPVPDGVGPRQGTARLVR
ncbi:MULTISPECIES: TadE/TadG family type IV pilus assembly protein [Brevundimonas]|uniref:TadE/TadG family type IV pilus assembly protein n=1 Tax=Brevundimonas TaxID=41275 RepID=UPI000F02790A|nr:pilus assembly protein TadG-related protein [Brevundimonas lutea]